MNRREIKQAIADADTLARRIDALCVGHHADVVIAALSAVLAGVEAEQSEPSAERITAHVQTEVERHLKTLVQ